MFIVILGAPGAGKGTQAHLLAEAEGLQHISSGDLLREATKADTPLGRQVRPYMERGELVPDEIVIALIKEKLESLGNAKGVILDGFPRNREQAENLDRALAAAGKSVDLALLVDVSEAELVRRIAGRALCQSCQAPYHLEDNPPQVAGQCDRCGGQLYQRPDDSAEVFRDRLRVYESHTAPLIEYYRQAGKLVAVNGEQDIEKVHQDLLAKVRVRSKG